MRLTKWVFGLFMALAPLQSAQAETATVTLGLYGGPDTAPQMAATQCLQSALQDAFPDTRIVLLAADGPRHLRNLSASGAVDIVWLTSWDYAWVNQVAPDQMMPVLVRKGDTGLTGFYSILVARQDSGFAGLDALAGTTLSFGSPRSQSGYFVPDIELHDELGPLDGVDGFFAELRHQEDGHSAALSAVLSGAVDAAIVLSHDPSWTDTPAIGPLHAAMQDGALAKGDLVELWRSSMIPYGPVLVREGVGDAFVTQLVALSARDPSCLLGAFGSVGQGFEPVRDPGAWRSLIRAFRKSLR